MNLKHLFIIDPIEKLHIHDDTSLYLMDEIIKNNHNVYYCTEYDIIISSQSKQCKASIYKDEKNEQKLYNLEDFDFIHIRKDPPFDMSYVTLLLLLQTLQNRMVINDPKALLQHNEKMVIFNFPDVITDTLVSSNLLDIKSFVKELGGSAILKPLYSCRGQGVVLLNSKDQNFENVIQEATDNEIERVMIQKFQSSIINGETRVILIDGDLIATLKKIPKKGSIYTNLHSGALLTTHELTPGELSLCKQIGEFCKKEGLFFTAIDIIDEKLSEINMTSPSLLRQADKIYNKNFARILLEKLQRKIIDS